MLKLPIDSILPELVAALEKGPSVVLQASPGSGKTTRVPPALLKAAFRGEGEILVLEPRRLAAKWAARRVAEEYGEPVGQTIGYQFRFENVSGPRTKVRFLTEGMLMRRLLNDPLLKGVSAVLLDEFHERHLHGDIALGYLRWLQQSKRPDLRLVVMSATLDSETIAAFLGGAPILRVDTRIHPIDIQHLPSPAARHLDLMVKDAVAQAVATTQGDILVFLPGMADIRRAGEALAPLAASRGLHVLQLHGELSREDQDRAMGRLDRRKVILSTNIAETSLTIEGVDTVIDSGLHRIASYSWWSGVPALRTRPISRASAIQRAGRAGRTGPGRCFRLYTKGEFETRAPFEVPEIQRADITQTYLELKSLGVAEPEAFPWFERPSPQALEASRRLLWLLGALASDQPGGALTELGKRMVTVPAHPRIARMLLEAEKRDLLEPAFTLAALIGEGELSGLDALEEARRRRDDPALRRARDHLSGAFGRGKAQGRMEELGFCVLSGFPDRVAMKKPVPGSLEAELLFSAGGSARVEDSGVMRESEMFVTLDIQEQKHMSQARSKVVVRSVCPVKPEWLFDLTPSLIGEKEVVEWDAQRGRVSASQRMVYGELVLTEEKVEPRDPEQIARVVLKNALGVEESKASALSAHDWVQALSRLSDAETIEAAFARAFLLAEHLGLALPDPWALVRGLLASKSTLAELKETDWHSELAAALGAEHLSKLESLLPLQLALPSGRKTKVHYKLGQPPWVESRLQDFFGMKKGPAILGGRVPLTLHLLAPNYRAVQVTTDLAGFWERGYQEVRGQLSRRYPRHKWPEDPRALYRED